MAGLGDCTYIYPYLSPALEFLVWTVTRYHVSVSLTVASLRLYVACPFAFGQSSHLPSQGMAQTFSLSKEWLKLDVQIKRPCCTASPEPIAAAKYSSTVLVCSLASRFGINQHVALIKFEGGTRKRT